MTKDTDFEQNLKLYLKRSFCKGKIIDVPCYIDEMAIQKSSKLIKKFKSLSNIFAKYYKEYVDDNAEFEDYFTPGSFQALAALNSIKHYFFMQLLAKHGHLKMMKVISPLLDNPNLQNPNDLGKVYENNFTPFNRASEYGQLKIIKFLEPFTDINAIQIAIGTARLYHQDHIVKYLNPLYS